MRIAMFTETFLPGTDGIVTRLCATLRHLEAEGHEVLLFAPSGAPERYASARVIGVPAFRFFLYPEKRFAMPWFGFGREIKEFRPDLIHTVNPAFVGLSAIYYAKRYQIPLVASYHTNVPAYARHYHLNFLGPALWWYFRTLHNRAQINLCTSRATMRELEAQRFENVGLWERGVDVELYRSAKCTEDMRRRLGGTVGPNERILLYVGRLATEKGIERLRPALDALPNVHLAIVGDGPHRESLERTFAGSNTVFTGYMHGETLAEAYASADGFVFPSTTETLGLVLFEAMASGLPVMAANSAPTREVLENGKFGFIFDSEDSESVVQTVHELFSNETRRQEILRQVDGLIENLDWSGPSKQLVGHYERLLSQQPVSVSSPQMRGTR
jgi:glycosyltransferase involved in cell wall biosynthesis